jgi:hypothetical protein
MNTKWKRSKSSKWYKAICRAARARRGKPVKFSPKRSKCLKRRWKDATYRKNILYKLSAGRARRWKSKANVRKHSKQQTKMLHKLWKDPKWRAKMEQARRDQVTPKVLKKLSKRMKAQWADPVFYEKMCKIRKTQSKGNMVRSPQASWYRTKYKGTNGKFWMRSGWEVAFALWLDHYGISWEYETKKFWLHKGRYYTPDFYLPDQDEYVELKGWFSKKDERKMLRFNILYPDVKLYVFFAQHMNKIVDRFRPRKK